MPFNDEVNKRIAVTIAHRAAMRVLPVAWSWVLHERSSVEVGLSIIGELRFAIVCGVAVASPSQRIKNAAAEIADPTTPVELADVAYAAAAAVAANTADAAAFAATTAFASTNSLASGAVWHEVRADCHAFTEPGVLLDETPLWSGPNPFERDWQDIRAALPPDWAFWRDWYQDALDGKKPNWDMLTEIALIAPEDWEKGADHVNGLIARIVEKHNLLDEVRRLRAELAEAKAHSQPKDMRGHNNPPELIVQEAEVAEKIVIVWDNLSKAEQELEKPAPDPSRLKSIGQMLLTVLKYFGNLADIMAKEAAKSIGKRAGGILFLWIASRTPEIQAFAESLIKFAESLF